VGPICKEGKGQDVILSTGKGEGSKRNTTLGQKDRKFIKGSRKEELKKKRSLVPEGTPSVGVHVKKKKEKKRRRSLR